MSGCTCKHLDRRVTSVPPKQVPGPRRVQHWGLVCPLCCADHSLISPRWHRLGERHTLTAASTHDPDTRRHGHDAVQHPQHTRRCAPSPRSAVPGLPAPGRSQVSSLCSLACLKGHVAAWSGPCCVRQPWAALHLAPQGASVADLTCTLYPHWLAPSLPASSGA